MLVCWRRWPTKHINGYRTGHVTFQPKWVNSHMTFFFDFTSLVEIKPLNSLDLRTVAFGTVRMWREVTGLILSKLLILQKEQFENTFYIIIYITNYHDLKLERNTQLSLFLIVSIIFGWLYPESKIVIMEFIILKEMVCNLRGFSTTVDARVNMVKSLQTYNVVITKTQEQLTTYWNCVLLPIKKKT